MQMGQHDCGPAAVHNALAALGHHRSLDELRALCGATASDGTSERQLWRAVQRLKESCGLSPWRIREGKKEPATGLLVLAMSRGRPAVLAVDFDPSEDDAGHWVAVIGMLGQRYLVADSAAAEMVVSVDGDELFRRWDCRGRTAYYAVVL